MVKDKTLNDLFEAIQETNKLLCLLFLNNLPLKKDKIIALSKIGFQNSSIARLLGCDPSEVRGTLTREKKKGKKKKDDQ